MEAFYEITRSVRAFSHPGIVAAGDFLALGKPVALLRALDCKIL